MKKYSCLIFFLCLVISSTCFADIPYERVALGGIQFGTTMERVKSIYGEPDKIEHSYNYFYSDNIAIHYYGYTLIVEYNSENTVVMIDSYGENDIATPDGVKVGMNKNILSKIYGTPRRHHVSPKSVYYPTEKYNHIGIRFDLYKDRITQIRVGLFD